MTICKREEAPCKNGGVKAGAGTWGSVGGTCRHAALEEERLVHNPHDEEGARQVAKKGEEPNQATGQVSTG